MKEQWKPIEGYENYQVSTYGRVKSLGNSKSRKEKLLKPGKNKGYLHVALWKNGVKERFYIHRLVYSAFVGDIPDGMDINHLDENKENNHLENLEACSHGDNIRWGTGIARRAAAQSKAVEALDKVTGRVVYVFPSIAEVRRQGFDRSTVSQCCRGKVKSHGGFIWRFKEN